MCNLPLFTTQAVVRAIFGSFGEIVSLELKEYNKPEKKFYLKAEPLAPRVAVVKLHAAAVQRLEDFNEDEDYVFLDDHDIASIDLLEFYLSRLREPAQPQAPEPFANLFLNMFRDQRPPEEVDGWKINYHRNEDLESKRVKKHRRQEFHKNFYRISYEDREQNLLRLRERKARELKFMEEEARDGVYDRL